MVKVMYTTKATATGGRSGSARTEDGVQSVTLTVPKELGGDGAVGTNPEQLFALGYSACFLGALKNVASREKVKVPEDSTVTATVSFRDRPDGQGFWIQAGLEVHIPGMDKAQAQSLVEKAHVVCPYSEVSRNGFDVTLDVV
jgi:lipoyl-dependent peroxiredoxin